MKKSEEKKKEPGKDDVIFNVPIGIKYYITPLAILISAIAITVIIVLSR